MKFEESREGEAEWETYTYTGDIRDVGPLVFLNRFCAPTLALRHIWETEQHTLSRAFRCSHAESSLVMMERSPTLE